VALEVPDGTLVTRWGILSDIHGNLPALERALAEFRARGVDRIAVLGDNLGRGDSDGCVERIREAADVSVVGNRDLDWQDRVHPDTTSYVLGLPRLAQVDGIVFSHGDPRLTRELSTVEISGDFRRARAWLAERACRTWMFGHSHRARVWNIPASDEPPRLQFDAAVESLPAVVDLSDRVDSRSAINAGSVGLPFPGKGPASALLFDSAAGRVEIFPV
jgi:predicted phosphodiesterase